MKKQNVYLPVKVENVKDVTNEDRLFCRLSHLDNSMELIEFNRYKEGEFILYTHELQSQNGYFFTPEELNEYTQNVIKQSLETAAEKAETIDTYKTRWSGLNKESFIEKDVYKKSITNTLKETFDKFKV